MVLITLKLQYIHLELCSTVYNLKIHHSNTATHDEAHFGLEFWSADFLNLVHVQQISCMTISIIIIISAWNLLEHYFVFDCHVSDNR